MIIIHIACRDDKVEKLDCKQLSIFSHRYFHYRSFCLKQIMSPRLQQHLPTRGIGKRQTNSLCAHCRSITKRKTNDMGRTFKNGISLLAGNDYKGTCIKPLEFTWSIPSTYKTVFLTNRTITNVSDPVTNIPEQNRFSQLQPVIEFVFNHESSEDEAEDLLDDFFDAFIK